MKKKLLSILAVAAVSAVALVGCGGDDHTHNYKWKFEGDKHWQECSCGDKKGESSHVDEKINATGAAGKDELCDVCGADLHKHVYQWNSTALVHWQECACGDKTEEVAHVDEKNNETNAAGADEKCDACGRGFYAVTFNLGGHGTVATQYIGKDGKVAQPETPADDDSYKFKGWYKDAAHQTEFDFDTETVTAATEIFAWFEDDTTPGASRNHAYELELDSLLGNPQKAKKNEVVYYSFTAEESGRYMLALGAGENSQNATFTTSMTGDTVFGKDCDADEIAVDVDEGDTVYLLFKYLGDEGEDVNVSPVVSTVTDEALPEGVFKDGEYANNTYTVVLDTATKTMTVGTAYTSVTKIAKYIGGKYNTLTIIDEIDYGGGYVETQTYTFTPKADGTYTLKINDGYSEYSYALNYFEAQNPVALGNIVGYYEPKGEATDGMTELYIYSSDYEDGTSVIYKIENQYYVGYNGLSEATYDTEKNVLSTLAFQVRLKLGANDAVESLLIGGNEYVKKGELGEAPPARLPLGDSDVEYNGATHKIKVQYGSQYLGEGNDAIIVMGYDKTTHEYTVYVVSNNETHTYYVTVSDDHKTIELYDDGKTKLDTLSVFEREYHDLPTTEETLNIAAADYQKNLYVLVAQQAGWYNIAATGDAVVYYQLNDYSINNLYFYDSRVAQGDIYLEEGDCVGVYVGVPAATTVSVAPVTSPAGTTSENPKALVNGKATLDVVVDLDSEDTQYAYFTYTATEAGTFAVKATHGNMNSNCDVITVNDQEYYLSWTDPAANIALTNDLTVSIAVQLNSMWDYITVTVVEDITIEAVPIELEGTPANDVLNVSKNVPTGVNYLVDTKGAPITVTGSAAFSVKLQDGTVVTAEESEGSYVAVIPAYVETDDGNLNNVYFRLVSVTEQTLALTQTHAKGSAGYPLEIELTDGAAELEVEIGVQNAKYFVLTPGTYSLSSSINQLRVILNGDDFLSFEAPFEVKEGDVLMCVLYYSQDTATLTITEVVEVFTADQVGTYEGHGSVDFFGETYDYDLKLSFNKFGVGTYWVDDQDYDIAIKDNGDGTYLFTYDDNFEVSFTFDNGVLKLTDEDKSDDVVTTEKAAVSIDGPYSGDINDTPSQIIISGDGTKVTYISGGETLASNATLVYDKDEDEYSFTYYYGMYTVTMKITGDTMHVVDDIFEGTLTKE